MILSEAICFFTFLYVSHKMLLLKVNFHFAPETAFESRSKRFGFAISRGASTINFKFYLSLGSERKLYYSCK